MTCAEASRSSTSVTRPSTRRRDCPRPATPNSEHTLQCDLGHDDGTNHVTYTISPARVETDTTTAPDPTGLPSLARDNMYRVGTAIVDLREPNVAKIGLEPGQGVHISPAHVGEFRD